MRFGMQQTPTMMVKPYLLMPLKKRWIIDCFLIQTLTDGLNYIYHFLFIPYIFIAWCGGTSLALVLATLLVLQLLIYINSQWYLFVRTFVNRNLLWWILPVAVYGLSYGLPMLIFGFGKGFEKIADASLEYAMHPVTIAVYTALFALLFTANRMLQQQGVDEEVAYEHRTFPV